ncbi:hypothetical protein [Carnobacterium sp. TMP28]|uniref:hypothetical protein n=1 Tax=Carnobacterium sp. TMP28 TaxID=3397060 RepID=UPI0039DF361F
MSTEVMVWMKIKSKNYDKKSEQGFKAFLELLKHNTINIEDPRTGHTLTYLSEINNEKIFKKMDEFDGNTEVTLMGQGDSWSFESAQYLLDFILEYKEPLIISMGYKEKDREKLRKLFAIIETSDLKLEFTTIIYREEDMDSMGGFEEFVWCSNDGCKVPAEYNFKLLEDGRIKGKDDFPASCPLKNDDIPYCEKHFYQRLNKEIV